MAAFLIPIERKFRILGDKLIDFEGIQVPIHFPDIDQDFKTLMLCTGFGDFCRQVGNRLPGSLAARTGL
jgi:hypothetical protein